jgi:glucan phosphoethanolaminetransferase (alkaline phosphatase superfamily)
MRVAGIAAVLLVFRIAALADHQLVWSVWSPIAYLWQDMATILLYAALDRALTAMPRAAWSAYAVCVLYVAGGIPVTRIMSTPMTLTMWRAAGGALGDSIRYYVTVANVAWLSVAIVVASGPWIYSYRTSAVTANRSIRRAEAALALTVISLGPTATTRVDTRGLDRNPWSALMSSAIPHTFTAESRAAPRTWLERDAAPSLQPGELARFRGVAADRHVVLVSLESAAAQYLGVYGASPDVMPNLSTLARSAIVFDEAYAVYPESIKGLLSVLCSKMPAFDRPAASYADVPLPSLASTLRNHGYRTALFHSGRFDYLGMNAVIQHRGFEMLADAGDIGGNHRSSFGVDDRTTVARLLEWIDRAPRTERFFVTYLPIAGHHPYDAPEAGPFEEPSEFGRYRNALHYSDAALGDLVRGLDARGLREQTALIVYGDHGEAFGQHDGNFGHTFQLYEENVHVPLVVALPGVQRVTLHVGNISSLIDIAPTVLDLLALPAEPAFEGRSLLDDRTRTALFFADYSLRLAGVRDGSLKYIRDIGSGRSHLFDLERDPAELNDISASDADEAARYAGLIHAWFGRPLRFARLFRE